MLPAHGTQTFTEDGTFTVPAGVHKILITACGGGGGGKSISGGWGADYIVKRAFSVEPNAVIPITVGKGGLGQDTNSDPEIEATDGGTTIIGNLITISGGLKVVTIREYIKAQREERIPYLRLLVFRVLVVVEVLVVLAVRAEVRALEMVEMVVPMASIPLVRMLPTEEQVPAAAVVRSV